MPSDTAGATPAVAGAMVDRPGATSTPFRSGGSVRIRLLIPRITTSGLRLHHPHWMKAVPGWDRLPACPPGTGVHSSGVMACSIFI
jgi:hypothetical protein